MIFSLFLNLGKDTHREIEQKIQKNTTKKHKQMEKKERRKNIKKGNKRRKNNKIKFLLLIKYITISFSSLSSYKVIYF